MNETDNAARAMLRHTLATLAYRAGRPLRDAPEGFAEFTAPSITNSPVKLLAHISGLLDWALNLAKGERQPYDATPLEWHDEINRFYRQLAALDEFLDSSQALQASPQQLFQGPIADALTHVGQLSLLRRLAGAPVKGENYFLADIQSGKVGPEQSAPRREF